MPQCKAGSLKSRIIIPSRDQIPKASLAAINKGDANIQIDGGILSRDGPNLCKLGQDVKVKLANL